LKDLIWTEINKESNKVVEITHRPMQIVQHDIEEDDIDEDVEEDEDDDLSKYKGIGWDEL
jgi:GTP-binding protein